MTSCSHHRVAITIPDLIVAPELAAIALLDAALVIAVDALCAQHPTLLDDCHNPYEDGQVVSRANDVRLIALSLRETLNRYTRAVRDAARPSIRDEDLPF